MKCSICGRELWPYEAQGLPLKCGRCWLKEPYQSPAEWERVLRNVDAAMKTFRVFSGTDKPPPL